MKKTTRFFQKRILFPGTLAIILAMVMMIAVQDFSMTCFAQSQGKVTASSANIRKEPNGSSEAIGSAVKDTVITINNQVQGTDGHIWYQTFVDADTLGYIRSDLVEITDGSTPTTVTQVPATTPTEEQPAQVETPAGLTEVNPIEAKVQGGTAVRVRSNASTSSQIITTVAKDDKVTVYGTVDGEDGKVWYLVSFTADGKEITGYLRSDFAKLSGDLVPATPETPAEEEPAGDPEPEQPPVQEEIKDFDTKLVDGEWFLIDNVKLEQQSLQDLFDMVDNNAKAYETASKKVKSQKAVIIILVLLLVAAAGAIGFLVYKIRDMMDSAYFRQVENETIRRRENVRAQGGQQKVMHSVGAEKTAGNRQGQRYPGQRAGAPQGQRPTGAPQGQRPTGAPQGQRPTGAPQGQKPTGASQGQRPTGAPQGQRPTGAPQGQRPTGAPQGQRPTGAPQGQRPTGAPQGQRPTGAPQGQRPVEGSQEPGIPENSQEQRNVENPQEKKQDQEWKSRNFLEDYDAFEFVDYDDDKE